MARFRDAALRLGSDRSSFGETSYVGNAPKRGCAAASYRVLAMTLADLSKEAARNLGNDPVRCRSSGVPTSVSLFPTRYLGSCVATVWRRHSVFRSVGPDGPMGPGRIDCRVPHA